MEVLCSVLWSNSILGHSFDLHSSMVVHSRVFVLVTFSKGFAKVGVRTQIQWCLPLLVLDAEVSPIPS